MRKVQENFEPYIPLASISPDKIAIRWARASDHGTERGYRSKNPLPKFLQPKEDLSIKAERRIKKAIQWLLELTEWQQYFSESHGRSFNMKINFVTLTLPAKQFHPDSVIKKDGLNHFLTVMRSQYGVTNYFWRAESQKNGNIHFHVCMDKYVHWSTIRKVWVGIMSKLGYVANYRKEMENFHALGFRSRPELYKNWSKNKQFEAYKTGLAGNWSNPNCTDVHAVAKLNNVAAYLAKYCCKKEQYRAIEGKIWGLSQGLSRCKPATVELIGKEAEETEEIIALYPKRHKVFERCQVAYVAVRDWCNWAGGTMYRHWRKHVDELKKMMSDIKKVRQNGRVMT